MQRRRAYTLQPTCMSTHMGRQSYGGASTLAIVIVSGIPSLCMHMHFYTVSEVLNLAPKH